MKKSTILSIVSAAVLALAACNTEKAIDTSVLFSSLLDESNAYMQQQDAENAMQKAIEALDLASSNNLEEYEAEAMNSIASIDLATSRDEHSWKYAEMAEELSREKGFDRNLAKALLIKARICCYASYAPDNNRDDEALPYLEEALRLSESTGDVNLQIDAYYSLCQIFVNKNRWNDVLDPSLFNLAESNLSKGEAIAASNGLQDLVLRGLLFRTRLLRQASKYSEAVECCTSVLDSCRDDDYLTKYQIYDQLTSLYHGLEDYNNANESHMNTLNNVEMYISQKADEQLQKMEAEYEAELKEQTIKKNRYLITCLALALVLFACLIAFLIHIGMKAKKRNLELEHKGKDKDKIISFLSDDLDVQELDKNKESLDTAVADYVSSVMAKKDKNAKKLGLTKRELEIMRLCANGESAASIAEKLNISLRTVNNHKFNIFSKMGVSSTSEMTAKAHKMKIL